MIYYEDDIIQIFWDESNRLIHTKWNGFAAGQKYRNGLRKAQEIIESNRARLYLADQRNLRLLDKEDQIWVKEIWFPSIGTTSLRKLAILMSDQKATQNFITQILKTSVPPHIELKVCQSEEEALKWLSLPLENITG